MKSNIDKFSTATFDKLDKQFISRLQNSADASSYRSYLNPHKTNTDLINIWRVEVFKCQRLEVKSIT